MEISNKRPLENGCLPKHKPRRVSGTRDFPPGCGPNAMPVKLKSVGNGGREAGAVVADIKVECQSNDVVNTTLDADMTESLDALVGNVAVNAAGGVSNDAKSYSSDEKPAVGGLVTSEELNGGEHSALVKKSDMEVDPVDDKEELLLGNARASTCVRPKDKYCMRRVSGVRDFPPYCGRSVSLLTEEERVMIAAGKGRLHTAMKSKNVTENGTIEGMPQTSQRECLDGPVGKMDITDYSADRSDKGGRIHSGFNPVKEEVTLQNSNCRAGAENVSQPKFSQMTSNAAVVASNHEIDGNPNSSSTFNEEKYLEAYDDEGVSQITPISMAFLDTCDTNSSESYLKDMVDYSTRKGAKKKPSDSVFRPAGEVNRNIVHGLMASPNCPWGKGKSVSSNPGGKTNGGEIRKQISSWRLKAKAVAKKSISKVETSALSIKKLKNVRIGDADQSPGALVLSGDEENQYGKSPHSRQTRDFEVNLPPFGPNSSGDTRDRVRDALRVFNCICRKLLQREEANSKSEEDGENSKKIKRIDLLAAKTIKEMGKEVNTGKAILGDVPGVEVGDEFQYRVELSIIGIHRLYQNGIDSMKLKNGELVATSIVSSGAYTDDLENADVLVYSGQGGNVVGKQKQLPQDQKLERGNLALKNSIEFKTPVRVVRGWRDKAVDPHDPKPKLVMTYVYDGLYTVQRYWMETGPHGKQVFMFELRRNPGQPELAWKELKKSKKSKSRPGVCAKDISGGKERFGICGVNTLDDEKPPLFNYISEMMYPGWHEPIAPPGCDCKGRCSDSKKCKCAVRNDGEIPYNHNGALVETKLLIYECGPHCRCPPTCYNRVSQRGIRYQLEIFKTKSRGWGVRALTSIPSGGFICEYAGELLKDIEAEQRIGNDEYLFDIGKNLTESSVNLKHQEISAELLEDGGYTIDACQYGNIGRFINHCCTPNLYAQNVIYDHDDMKMPHIMLFAMENIPPLQELTYHYNYSVNQIRDSDGNIKVKKCYCGTAECTGRLY